MREKKNKPWAALMGYCTWNGPPGLCMCGIRNLIGSLPLIGAVSTMRTAEQSSTIHFAQSFTVHFAQSSTVHFAHFAHFDRIGRHSFRVCEKFVF